MPKIAKVGAKGSKVIIHRHMQQKFNMHRDKLDAHKQKGGPFAEAVKQLEKHLFG